MAAKTDQAVAAKMESLTEKNRYVTIEILLLLMLLRLQTWSLKWLSVRLGEWLRWKRLLKLVVIV